MERSQVEVAVDKILGSARPGRAVSLHVSGGFHVYEGGASEAARPVALEAILSGIGRLSAEQLRVVESFVTALRQRT